VLAFNLTTGGIRMPKDNQFSDFINELSLQTKMENIWSNTCGSWENCNETTIQSFLSQCEEYSIDSQYCMSWVEQHKDQIPNWAGVSETSLGWINQHTSTGSPFSVNDENLS
jgi:hypothetical protein